MASTAGSLRDFISDATATLTEPASSAHTALALNAAIARTITLATSETACGTSEFQRRRLEQHLGDAFVRLFQLSKAAGVDVSDAVIGSLPQPKGPAAGALLPNQHDGGELLATGGQCGPAADDSLTSAPYQSAMPTSGLHLATVYSTTTRAENTPDNVETRASQAIAAISMRDIPTVQSCSASPVASSLPGMQLPSPPYALQRAGDSQTDVLEQTAAPKCEDVPLSILKRKAAVSSPERVSPAESPGTVPDSARSRDKHASFCETLVERVDVPAGSTVSDDAAAASTGRRTPEGLPVSCKPPLAGVTPPKSRMPILHASPPALRQIGSAQELPPAAGAAPAAPHTHSRTSSSKMQTPCSPSGQPLFGILEADNPAMMMSDDEFLGTLGAVNVTSIHSTSASPCGTKLLPPQFRRPATSPKPPRTPALATLEEVGTLAANAPPVAELPAPANLVEGGETEASTLTIARQTYYGSREDIVALIGSPDFEDSVDGPAKEAFPKNGSHDEFGTSLQSEAVMDALVLPPPAERPHLIVTEPQESDAAGRGQTPTSSDDDQYAESDD